MQIQAEAGISPGWNETVDDPFSETMVESAWLDTVEPDLPGDIMPGIVENESSTIAYI